MRQVPVSDMKAHLAQLLSEVEQGEEVMITRRGEAIAHLVPARFSDRQATEAALERIRRRRAKLAMPLTREEILAFRHEGHSHQ